MLWESDFFDAIGKATNDFTDEWNCAGEHARRVLEDLRSLLDRAPMDLGLQTGDGGLSFATGRRRFRVAIDDRPATLRDYQPQSRAYLYASLAVSVADDDGEPAEIARLFIDKHSQAVLWRSPSVRVRDDLSEALHFERVDEPALALARIVVVALGQPIAEWAMLSPADIERLPKWQVTTRDPPRNPKDSAELA